MIELLLKNNYPFYIKSYNGITNKNKASVILKYKTSLLVYIEVGKNLLSLQQRSVASSLYLSFTCQSLMLDEKCKSRYCTYNKNILKHLYIPIDFNKIFIL